MQDGYHISLLTYIDILGFRGCLGRRSAAEIRSILSALDRETKPDGELAGLYAISFHSFSDLVVREVNVTFRDNLQSPAGLLFYELHDLVFAQARLAQKGILLRGAVTIGEIHSEPGMIFGPALVKAYELESTIAVYPRIIVDPDVFEVYEKTPVLKRDNHDHDTDKEYVASQVSRDLDGVYFVDYLRAIRSEDPECYPAFMAQHRDLIVRELNEVKGLNSKSAKYGWLTRYHNSVVDESRLDSTFRIQGVDSHSVCGLGQ